MTFHEEFESDMHAAFEFWKTSQLAAAKEPAIISSIKNYPIEKWATEILSTTVYGLIKQKRIQNA